MKNGDENQKNVAFVQIDDLPEYKMCLQKKGITTNDDEIFNIIKETGITYYRYYAVADDGDEKVYLDNFEEAEEVVDELKDKDSNNASDLTIVEKYETELPELASTDDAVSKLYEKKVVTSSSTKYASSGSSNLSTSRALNYNKVNLGMSLIRPVSGVLTSRYGYRWGRTHTGIDIGAPTGTAVKCAASGKVTFSGWKGELGNLVVVTHSNGIQTYYGHCSKLLVTAGQTVSAGDVIAKVGSTGRSTGSHLHFEIRINGGSINPQGYIGY
jgi:murein DD-endopeptidase MepM/ murein hydrolase activator NlpD